MIMLNLRVRFDSNIIMIWFLNYVRFPGKSKHFDSGAITR